MVFFGFEVQFCGVFVYVVVDLEEGYVIEVRVCDFEDVGIVFVENVGDDGFGDDVVEFEDFDVFEDFDWVVC